MLLLQLTQMPRSLDLAIFVSTMTTTMTQLITLPPVHARGVTITMNAPIKPLIVCVTDLYYPILAK